MYHKFYEEGIDYMNKGDSIQASEKLYKAAEEIIKLLSEHYKLKEYEEAKTNGRWDVRLLISAIKSLSEKITPEIASYCQAAWFLHVEGFHEMRLNIEQVKFIEPSIKKLVNIADKILNK